MMLDTKRTFDQVIERYAPDARTAQTILCNPLYQQLSTIIAGSSEYMAMEKLYELSTAHHYDLIILDTPPSAHALDFFRSPERMVRALTDSMLKLFVKPGMAAGKIGARLLSRGADTVMKMFGRVTGAEFLQEIADLMMSTVSLFGGFHDRAEEVQALLRAKTTGIILVTAPDTTLIEDAIDFVQQATAEQMHLAGAICNRMLPALPETPQATPADLPNYLRDNFATYTTQWQEQHATFDDLRTTLPKRVPLITMTQRDHAVNNLEDLQTLAKALTTTQ
jgi:anion-transporting  ArsA/GET3 family ATPase